MIPLVTVHTIPIGCPNATKAINAPVRETQKFADNQLKNEARLGLANANARKISGKKGFFADLFNSAVHAEVTQ
jgi:hypothetical protein